MVFDAAGGGPSVRRSGHANENLFRLSNTPVQHPEVVSHHESPGTFSVLTPKRSDPSSLNPADELYLSCDPKNDPNLSRVLDVRIILSNIFVEDCNKTVFDFLNEGKTVEGDVFGGCQRCISLPALGF